MSHGWEALRGDPMPWLLDPFSPNLQWRALIELVGRPADSPAVARARGGADAAEPIATLLADLMPDGSWASDVGIWEGCAGSGWRLLASAQWGADPGDPRLHAACEHLLETAPGAGGFARDAEEDPVPWLTARVLQALARLGWCRHSRFQEALAWLDEAAPRSPNGAWLRTDSTDEATECAVTPVALLDALTACGGSSRGELRNRAAGAVCAALASMGEGALLLGHPNFDRTDAAEALATLARADVGFVPKLGSALAGLQQKQSQGARWARDLEIPGSLPVGERSPVGTPSRWVTLNAAVAVLHFAVDAGLPRMFPQKPLKAGDED